MSVIQGRNRRWLAGTVSPSPDGADPQVFLRPAGAERKSTPYVGGPASTGPGSGDGPHPGHGALHTRPGPLPAWPSPRPTRCACGFRDQDRHVTDWGPHIIKACRCTSAGTAGSGPGPCPPMPPGPGIARHTRVHSCDPTQHGADALRPQPASHTPPVPHIRPSRHGRFHVPTRPGDGPAPVRQTLYMAMLAATRVNPVIRLLCPSGGPGQTQEGRPGRGHAQAADLP